MREEKPIILIFVSRYLPGYKSGGPVRTIDNLVKRLGDEYAFLIVTSDRDAMDESTYSGVTPNAWSRVGSAEVYYANRQAMSLSGVRRLLVNTRHDVLYLNSFFDPRFTVMPLLARYGATMPPVVLAPRGEFSPGAISLKSWKKRPYVWMAKRTALYRGLTWQASSETEACDIQRVLGAHAGRIEIAPDLPSANEYDLRLPTEERKAGEPLRIVFLSRISPKKNLDFALRVLAHVKVPVLFRIAGPISDQQYWRRCQGIIADLPDWITVDVAGSLEHGRVPRFIAQHDLFFLPTRGENYGHAIAEALAAGTPVLLSDATPWRNLERAGVGWDLSLDNTEGFIRAIETAAARGSVEYTDWRKRAVSYAKARLSDPGIIEANRRLFASVHTVATRGC